MTSQPTIWRATVLTLFPEMFPGPLGVSLAGKGAGVWPLGSSRHGTSGTPPPIATAASMTPRPRRPGMVLRADVLAAAIDAADAGGGGRVS